MKPSTATNDCQQLLQADRFRIERVGWDDSRGFRRWKDVVRHPGAVVILPVFDDGRICLIRNHRIAVGETLLEVPAGTLDPGEAPLECAKRELEEETGLIAGRMEAVGWFYVSPGILDEKMHLFFATELTEGRPNPMPDENIVNHVASYDEALGFINSGQIHDAKTMIALLRLPFWKAQQRNSHV